MKFHSFTFYFYILLFLTGLSSCQNSGAQQSNLVDYQDDLGRKIKVKSEVKRIVSLTPSVTELLGLICRKEQLVGRTEHCNYPAWVSSVKTLAVYPLDLEAVLELTPDLVLVKEGFISTAYLEKLQSLGIPVYVQRYTRLEDIFRHSRLIGQLTGNTERANFVADSLIAVREALRRSIPDRTKSAMVLIGSNPMYVYGQGSFCDEVLALSGFNNAAGKELHGEFPSITPEYLLRRNPEVLLGTEGIFEQEKVFTDYAVLKKLSAYQHKQYFIINSDLFSRPGPRIFQSVTALRTLK